MARPNANPDLTLNPDPNQVARLLTLTSAAMNTTTDADDCWCGGFEVDVSALSGQRLVVHGSTCQQCDPADKASELPCRLPPQDDRRSELADGGLARHKTARHSDTVVRWPCCKNEHSGRSPDARDRARAGRVARHCRRARERRWL